MSEKVNELETLLPDIEIEIGGEQITVHEYTFMEGMRVDAIAQPVLDDLKELFLTEDNGASVTIGKLSAVFGSHPEVISSLMAIAVGNSADWVRSMGDKDGRLLLMTWWRVNQHFFIRRLVEEMAARRAEVPPAEPSDGENASPA